MATRAAMDAGSGGGAVEATSTSLVAVSGDSPVAGGD